MARAPAVLYLCSSPTAGSGANSPGVVLTGVGHAQSCNKTRAIKSRRTKKKIYIYIYSILQLGFACCSHTLGSGQQVRMREDGALGIQVMSGVKQVQPSAGLKLGSIQMHGCQVSAVGFEVMPLLAFKKFSCRSRLPLVQTLQVYHLHER